MTRALVAPGGDAGVGETPRPAGALWTVPEVAEFLQLHPKTVYEFVARGTLPCVRLGSRLRFDPRDIASWVSARKEG